MSNKRDVFRADCSENYNLPPCPMCGGKLHIEGISKFRVAHFCKGSPRRQVKTGFCDTPEEAVQKANNGEFTIK
jgi:hypothetical protein